MYLRQFFRIQFINQLHRINPVKPFVNLTTQRQNALVFRQNYRTLFSIHSPSISSDDNIVDRKSSVHSIQKRYKKKKAGKQPQRPSKQEEDDDEDDSDSDSDSDQDEQMDDTKVVTTTVASSRLDAVGKTCFNMARAKIEEGFYNDLIRVNGERVGKKSYEVREGDEIDMIRGFNLEQRDRLDVNRINILKFDDKAASGGRFRISFRKTNKLTIDNYERDPYDGSLFST
ncbi:hypothetical protein BLA29_007757 [Euroglyphus maynei]|uniref:Mitochondrial transcription rescue factor 1 C-terminal domain-containing protein n=1 Tax=Euroglyphus maynei TaxID=6958 RepID=A0A1Y3B981_EURMA|nr:hypothetical protein BLA29_007757 [Euroglyphus maynei]